MVRQAHHERFLTLVLSLSKDEPCERMTSSVRLRVFGGLPRLASRPPGATSMAEACQWDRLAILGIRLSVAIQLEPTLNPGDPGRIAIRRESSQGALRRTHRTVEVPIYRQ